MYWIHGHGNTGVEIFSLLSGLGLYHSFSKDERVLPFYRRRIVRVFLPTVIVVAIYYGLQGGSTLGYVARMLVMPYWLGTGLWYVWYPPYILLMYLIYPALYRLQKKSPKLLLIPLVLSICLPWVARICCVSWAANCERGLTRITAFIVGCMIAPHVHRNEKVSAWWMIPLFAISLVVENIHIWPMNRLANLFRALFLIMAITALAPMLTRGTIRRATYRTFALMGGISLEIYLLQRHVWNLLGDLEAYSAGGRILQREIFCAILTILLAVLLQKFCHYLMEIFRKTPVPDCLAEERKAEFNQ